MQLNLAKKFIIIILAFMLLNTNVEKAFAGPDDNSLSKCESTTNCILINWKVDDVDKSFQDALSITTKIPRSKVIDTNSTYIHAEITSRIMHYIDDLEIIKIPTKKEIQIRSASRVGTGDFGVNRKRVVNFLNQLSIENDQQVL